MAKGVRHEIPGDGFIDMKGDSVIGLSHWQLKLVLVRLVVLASVNDAFALPSL